MRILLAEDEHELATWLVRALEQSQFQVDWVDDGRLVRRSLKATKYDALILDLGLPGLGGLELIARLRQRAAPARLLAFSMHRDPVWATQALRAGALGHVTKSSPPATLVEAVRSVHAGRRVLSPDIATEVADIATALHLSPKTVHNLHYQIKAKLGTRSDFELARLAWQNGWMDG